jgi:hypothetical protein
MSKDEVCNPLNLRNLPVVLIKHSSTVVNGGLRSSMNRKNLETYDEKLISSIIFEVDGS